RTLGRRGRALARHAGARRRRRRLPRARRGTPARAAAADGDRTRRQRARARVPSAASRDDDGVLRAARNLAFARFRRTAATPRLSRLREAACRAAGTSGEPEPHLVIGGAAAGPPAAPGALCDDGAGEHVSADAVPAVWVVGPGGGGEAGAGDGRERGAEALAREAGPGFAPVGDYRVHRSDWERSPVPAGKARHRARYRYAPMQALDPSWNKLRSWNAVTEATNPGERRKVVGYHHVRGVGGSTLHLQGDAHRLHPESMRMRS